LTILLHVVVAALYAAAALLCLPRAGAPPRSGINVASWIIAVVALHAVVITTAIVTPAGLDLSLANALSLVGALAVLVAWSSGLLRALPGVGAVVLPVAAVAALLPALIPNPHRFPYAGAPWAAAHIAVALTAYAFFIVAAAQALVLTGLEKRLHRGLPDAGASPLPPLLTLENWLFRLIAAGFVLLTLALGSGVLFSEQLFGVAFRFNHKNLFSVAAWVVFGALLAGRWRFGWRGRRAVIWILAGTGLLILAYLGSKFVLEVLLGR
jgi:ABC-type uncharacterized transport system permease subunit